MSLLNDPAFLDGAAGSVNRAVLTFVASNPVAQVSCSGEIQVIYLDAEGQTITDTYTNLSKRSIQVPTPAGSPVYIIGNVTLLSVASKLSAIDLRSCRSLTTLTLSGQTEITGVNIAGCKQLVYLDLSGCTKLAGIDLTENTALVSINLANCVALASLSLEENVLLESVDITNCSALPYLDATMLTVLSSLKYEGTMLQSPNNSLILIAAHYGTDLAAARAAAEEAAASVKKVERLLEQLPDGQAVTATVALHTEEIAKLKESSMTRVELVCEDDTKITVKGSSTALTYAQIKALVDDTTKFVTLQYMGLWWMLPSYDDGGAIMFTATDIQNGHPQVTRVIINTAGQLNNYTIVAEDADHKTNDLSVEVAADGDLTYPTTRAVNEIAQEVIDYVVSGTANWTTTGSKTILSGLNLKKGDIVSLLLEGDTDNSRIEIYYNTTGSPSRIFSSVKIGVTYNLELPNDVNSLIVNIRGTGTIYGDVTLTCTKISSFTELKRKCSDINQESFNIKIWNERHCFDTYEYYYPYEDCTFAGDTANTALIEESFNIRFRNKRTCALRDIKGAGGTFNVKLNKLFKIEGTQEMEIPMYIPDASAITGLSAFLNLSNESGGALGGINYQISQPLQDGWNLIRLNLTKANISSFSSYKYSSFLQLFVTMSSASEVYITMPLAIRPDKARVIFVDDHAYHEFYVSAYPRLKAIGVPVTWAIQPLKLGAETTDGTHQHIISQEDLDAIRIDPNSEISWHTYKSAQEQTMSKEELMAEFMLAVDYLRRNSLLSQYWWRAAWKQNNAQNAMSCSELCEAFATFDGIQGPATLPFNDRYNIERNALHTTELGLTHLFNALKATHSFAVIYTHSIVDDSVSDSVHITESTFQSVLAKLQEGLNDGWLEATTYNRLRLQFGILW